MNNDTELTRKGKVPISNQTLLYIVTRIFAYTDTESVKNPIHAED